MYSLKKNHTRQRDKEQNKEQIMKKSNHELKDIIQFEDVFSKYVNLKNKDTGLALKYFTRSISQNLAYFLSINFLTESSIVSAEKFLILNLGKYPEDTHESWLFRHQMRVLGFLKLNLGLQQSIRRISIHNLDPKINTILAGSLRNVDEKIDHEKILEAILVSLLYPLRQTIGSCFATSLVIVLQKEEMKQFVDEMISCLINQGIKRVIEGKEFLIPINLFLEKESFCESNNFLSPPPLLKCLEYTIASMTEFSLDTQTFSLSIILGLDPSLVDGLGGKIQSLIREELLKIEKEVHQAQIEAQKALDHVNIINSQLSQASSYERAQSLKAQGYSHSSQMRSCVEKRDELIKESEEISELLKIWIEKAREVFKSYFQDIFDPDLKITHSSLDDSPAGFRLLCKHGRQNILSWTKIHDEKTFVSCLKDYFLYLENLLGSEYKSKRIKAILVSISSESIQYIHQNNFIESSLKRLKMLNATYHYTHPWCYLSGGSLRSLLACFLGKTEVSNEVKIQTKEPVDLLIKLVDLFKDFPLKFQDRFLSDDQRGILAQNESHAFVVKPGFKVFSNFWSDRHFSYTTIRDSFLIPLYQYYQKKVFTEDEIVKLSSFFRERLSEADFYLNVKRIDIVNLKKTLLSDKRFKEEIVAGLLHDFLRLNDLEFPAINAITFADSNWAYFNLSFIVNPFNSQLEIWRESFDRRNSFPIKEWSEITQSLETYTLFLDTLDNISFSSFEKLKFQFKV